VKSKKGTYLPTFYREIWSGFKR